MGVGISIWPPHLGNWKVESLLLLMDSVDADRKGSRRFFQMKPRVEFINIKIARHVERFKC